jgi:carbamoyl-phosphate synthase small subunit
LANYQAVLALEDGTRLFGEGFGFPTGTSGEVVFNTGMVGYPETLTDPSYRGQILTQTYPLQGNYGVPSRDARDAFGFPLNQESEEIQVEGYVVHSHSTHPSHRTSDRTLDQWLKEEGIPGIAGIDTRMLTKKLRVQGTMLGVLMVEEEIQEGDIKTRLKEMVAYDKRDLGREVTVEEPVTHMGGDLRVVVLDCGLKLGITRNLLSRGATVIRVPHTYPSEKILGLEPSGILISNGPGDPVNYSNAIEALKSLIQEGIPIFGICLGTQLLTLAAGGETYKLKFGHRGQNHPCVDVGDKRCYITSQNHGYAVDPDSLSRTDFLASFVNANDGTVEGIRHKTQPISGVQFHPEGSPGPLETGFLFDKFMGEMRNAS